ncbi:aldo/keto reductase [Psychromarinibacter sp. C21-152]|uniref:Aldo/keto reductase n=1 Tax=Psychromarinibacter sediminicola TaxID=3033385 RepID=A0AAE3NNM6_9RHOB|nr:aldo/keto reductase [Psychromarinibacter sediminicola]MDF0599157.1 aldo/keto reductase [Psychromarinibacter sediminicola]
MDKITLGRSDLTVTRLCLGTMGWGSRNTEDEAHAQLDRAHAAGLTFLDTAEVYPTYPVKPETVGRTEEILGTWFARTGRRDDMVLATKVSAPRQKAARNGEGYSAAVLPKTVDGSLRRLQTDVIDLYQTHFPTRPIYHMRANWRWNPAPFDIAAVEAEMVDVLEGMDALIRAGKIRHWGLSNETAWGTATWLRLADANGLPRPVSVQNEYSLLCRLADTDLAELCVAETVPLLPFSPLGMGLLSDKYAPEVTPENTRRSVEATLNGRINPKVWPAVEAYTAIAARHGLDPCAMALAWTLTRPMVAAPIFGASSVAQLDVALTAAELELSDEVLEEIDEANRQHPIPF